MWVLRQSCQVIATEEAEVNGKVGNTILLLFCSPKSDQTKIIANSLRETSYSQAAPRDWQEMCPIQENVGGEAGLPFEKPCVPKPVHV